MPNRVGPDDGMIEQCAELGRRAAQAGRGAIPITIAGMMRDPARIERFEQAGVERSLFWLPSSGPEEVEQAMDRYAAAAQQYQSAGV